MSKESTSFMKEVIAELNEALECNGQPIRVNKELERCLVNLNSLNSLSENPSKLLANIKRILIESHSNSGLDFDLMLELLTALISKCPFEDVLSVFSIDDLIMSLQSDMLPLVNAACKVISRSYPKGLFANSQVFDILLNLYFDVNTDISVVNCIESALSELSSDELVRRRILVNNLPVLMAVRKGVEPIQMARLLQLLSIQCEYIDRSEFDEKLFTLQTAEIVKILDLDIVMFIHVLVYYTGLLRIANIIEVDAQSHEWMLKYALATIPTFGKVYAERETYPDVKYFARSYLFKFFRTISYLEDDSYFRSLDENFIKISEENEYLKDFLSFVHPGYLFKYHSSLLKQYTNVIPSKLGVIRNIVSDPQCFQLIKGQITADSILSMPYIEQMVLLQKLSQFSYAVQYLVHSLPKVMSNLIQKEGGDITESETVALRTETITNLLKYEPSDLDAWYIPLTDELAKIHGFSTKNAARTQVTSSYVQ